MRKILLLISCILVMAGNIFAQEVDSIRIEQAGEFVRIYYKLLNSTPAQTFRVRVLCSVNGGLYSEIRSISGDHGENVTGGRDQYMVLWDVLKDVEEVKSVDFMVRAELLSDLASQQKVKRTGKKISTSLMLAGFLPGPGYGARLSFTGKAGVSVLFSRGPAVILPNPANFNPSLNLHRTSLNLTFRFMNGKNSQLHFLLGPTIGQVLTDQYLAENQDWKNGIAPGLEAGAIIYAGKLAFSLSGAKLFQTLVEEDPAMSKHSYLTAGIGVRF